jgi:hypothetical protein
MSDSWETDFRWRRMRVSSRLLSALLHGDMHNQRRPNELSVPTSDPPADLTVIGLVHVQSGPNGWYEFVIWSSTLEPMPNDGERPEFPIPMADFTYSEGGEVPL